ncbi:SIR2 family protein [Georgenia sp. MJ170]|uniref:SIR2 family protein n=1 Tax=Georgenia sunbinii TaxID=3117728 RepID=UPI002F26518E
MLSFVNGLSEKLASRSRHVCLFVGAGASRACGLPDVAGLEEHLRTSLSGDALASFERLLTGRNLEQVLSRLRRIAALIQDTTDEVDGLTGSQANELDVKICRRIVDRLAISPGGTDPMLRLASWAARADYHHPVEIFTVNYDLLVETALEALGVPYFDGFVGTARARFRSDLVEASIGEDRQWLPAFLVRVWKLHGSVNWAWNTDPRPTVVRLGTSVPQNQPAAIYPSDAKYEESRRVPFVVLQDRLRKALEQPETLTLIAGYAFHDQHLNEIIFDAARRRPRSEVVAFCYSTIPEDLAALATTAPNVQVVAPTEAILGGLRRDWDEPDDPPSDVWTDGAVVLGDFNYLAQFLARSSPPVAELEAQLRQLLANVVKPGA